MGGVLPASIRYALRTMDGITCMLLQLRGIGCPDRLNVYTTEASAKLAASAAAAAAASSAAAVAAVVPKPRFSPPRLFPWQKGAESESVRNISQPEASDNPGSAASPPGTGVKDAGVGAGEGVVDIVSMFASLCLLPAASYQLVNDEKEVRPLIIAVSLQSSHSYTNSFS